MSRISISNSLFWYSVGRRFQLRFWTRSFFTLGHKRIASHSFISQFSYHQGIWTNGRPSNQCICTTTFPNPPQKFGVQIGIWERVFSASGDFKIICKLVWSIHGICWQQMPRQQIFRQQIPRQQTENQNHLFLGKMGDFQG